MYATSKCDVADGQENILILDGNRRCETWLVLLLMPKDSSYITRFSVVKDDDGDRPIV